MNNEIFPWQISQWQVLQQRRLQSKMPHALLLTGIKGIGKYEFAEQLGQSLICLQPNEQGFACGECKQCQLLNAKSHPDYIEILPEEEGKAIKVDAIRQLILSLDKTAQQGGYKVVIIYPADAMNINAENALLKTLEEPTKNTLIILISEHIMNLTATIRSRCQHIVFSVPDKTVALNWLKTHCYLYEGVDQKPLKATDEELLLLLSLSQGAPLRVLDFLANNELEIRKQLIDQWLDYMRGKLLSVDMAQTWEKIDFEQIYLHWNSWIMDMIRLQGHDQAEIINKDYQDVFEKILPYCHIKKLYLFLDELNKVRHWKNRHLNLNNQLMLEDLLIKNREILKLL